MGAIDGAASWFGRLTATRRLSTVTSIHLARPGGLENAGRPEHPLSTFLCYSHQNNRQRRKLRQHFVPLEREGLLRLWDDRELKVGQQLDSSVQGKLEEMEVFILLVSPEFLASDYCSSIEMKRALERHEAGTALVFPIIVGPCDWKYSPLAKLVVAPTDGRPITGWTPRDAGWVNSTFLMREAIGGFRERRSRPAPPAQDPKPPETHEAAPQGPAPSNSDPAPVPDAVQRVFMPPEQREPPPPSPPLPAPLEAATEIAEYALPPPSISSSAATEIAEYALPPPPALPVEGAQMVEAVERPAVAAPSIPPPATPAEAPQEPAGKGRWWSVFGLLAAVSALAVAFALLPLREVASPLPVVAPPVRPEETHLLQPPPPVHPLQLVGSRPVDSPPVDSLVVLTITSEPAGMITVVAGGRQRTGPSPFQVKVAPGQIKVEISSAGEKAFSKRDSFNIEATPRRQARTITAAQGMVLIRSYPASQISVDGVPRGDVPLKLKLYEGEHTIHFDCDRTILKCAGGLEATQTVTVKPGEESNVTQSW